MALSDRPVPMLVTPGPDFLPAFRAVVDGGGVVAPLSTAYPPAELAWFADDLGADTVVLSPELGDQAGALARGRRVIDPGALAAAARRRDPDPFVGDPAAPVLILYTSGTTGRPKAAELSRGNLASQTAALAAAWRIGSTDRMVHALPLHHLHGLVVALLTADRAGAAVELLPRFDAARVVDALARTDATVWMAVPTMYHRLRDLAERDADAGRALARAAARLRLATSGSAALPVGLAAWWRELHGAIPLERFGMTEIGIALSNPLDRSARRAGAVGTPIAGAEIRLDPDGASAGGGAGVAGEQVGELEVRGPGVFLGYRGQPAATAAAFTADGWFRTGDVAAIGADGVVRLLGRTSVDILKTGGYKLSALEIEEVLREHPEVAEVAVVGLPDAALGDRVVAAVVLAAARDGAPERLRAFCGERLARYKVPREIVLVDALPRTPLGKVQKAELGRALAARG